MYCLNLLSIMNNDALIYIQFHEIFVALYIGMHDLLGHNLSRPGESKFCAIMLPYYSEVFHQ